ncbi:hypothetical protein HJG60_008510 [Phyllostomus discolor]|uniref:Ig-like domain-containing protein n=1 Tax=Phyllostomus discolor TaxID=89673 RepID=A0A833Z7B9_9CHIR|nr:hypothetical protein HJG60_008510 [Phyllostomus discolor]
MLLLLQVIVVAYLWTYTTGDTQITQAIISITKKEGNTAFLECQIKDISRKNAYIHWYRQKPDQPLKRILYISSNDNVIHEQGVNEQSQLFQVPLNSSPCISNGDTKMRIAQDQLSFTRTPDKTVHITCKLSGLPLENAIVHWYEQKEGKPLTLILYGSTKNNKDDQLNSCLETYRKDDGIFYLIINNVMKSDEATYYCACLYLTRSQSKKEPVKKLALLLTLNSSYT